LAGAKTAWSAEEDQLVLSHGRYLQYQEAGGDRSEAAWRSRRYVLNSGKAVSKPDRPSLQVTGTSTLYDADGNVKLIWEKTGNKVGQLPPEELAVVIRESLDGYTPPASIAEQPQYTDSDLATVYPLADWHMGLLSWKPETGANYDLTIADGILRDSMERLIASAPPSEQAVVLGLGDLLHTDGFDNQTRKSKNILDVDGRYPKILQAAVNMVMYVIDLALQRHDRVLLRVLPGNHDEQSAVAVALALDLYYRSNERVTVDDSPSKFWFWTWGKVMLGATHGDAARMKDMPLIMATRQPEAWGRAQYRHCFTGHVHHDSSIEQLGVTVESFQTPAAPDSWHVAQGYGAGRSVKSITYSRENGEVMRSRINLGLRKAVAA